MWQQAVFNTENGLYNTQFRTENVIPNQDLMQKAVSNKELLNLWQPRLDAQGTFKK